MAVCCCCWLGSISMMVAPFVVMDIEGVVDFDNVDVDSSAGVLLSSSVLSTGRSDEGGGEKGCVEDGSSTTMVAPLSPTLPTAEMVVVVVAAALAAVAFPVLLLFWWW